MLLQNLVQASQRIRETSKRLEKVSVLAELIRSLHPDEVEIAVPFLSGSVRQGNIGIGYASLRDALTSPAATPGLALHDIDNTLNAITKTSGSGSESRKRELLRSMLSRAVDDEQHFLVALLTGELRQGALEGIMLDGLAKATGIPLERIRRAAMMAGGVTQVARSALERGEATLDQYSIQLFRPVQPMLAQTAEDVSEAIHDLGEAALEYKFDGARIQAHKSGDEVRIFSRRLNEVTAAIPEIVHAVRNMPAHDLILDGEVIGLTPQGRPQPFQITMKRFGRKLDVERIRSEIPLQPFWFDLIYLDGGSIADEAQARRFATLSSLVPPGEIVPNLKTASPEQAEDFLHQALGRGHEGIMAKAPGAGYAAGARGQSWLKIKQARTLDLVVLAAEWGHGRRKGRLSNLHLGARDTVSGSYAMLGKTFKGLTDEMLAWQTEQLLKLEVARDTYTVYVEPKLVVEIAFNEIQVSPTYASGLALRFARVKRYRPDKSAGDADTFETVQKLAAASA